MGALLIGCFLAFHSLSFHSFISEIAGLEKNINSSLPLGQVTLTFCLHRASLSLLRLMIYWADDLPSPLPSRQVRMNIFLLGRKIFLTQVTRKHLFQVLERCLSFLFCMGAHDWVARINRPWEQSLSRSWLPLVEVPECLKHPTSILRGNCLLAMLASNPKPLCRGFPI